MTSVTNLDLDNLMNQTEFLIPDFSKSDTPSETPPQPVASSQLESYAENQNSLDEIIAENLDTINVPLDPQQLTSVENPLLSSAFLFGIEFAEEDIRGLDIELDIENNLTDAVSALDANLNSTVDLGEVVPDSMEPQVSDTPVLKALVGKPKKVSRKRRSTTTSDAGSVAEDLSSGSRAYASGGRQKKSKMYENPDKDDPLVARAGYAKNYRDRKKIEFDNMKIELGGKKRELADAHAVISNLQKHDNVRSKKILELETENKQLKLQLKHEQDKNALNPDSTETFYSAVASVVQASCPKNVTRVNVIVPERLANKKVTALGLDKIIKIGSDASLEEKSCTFLLDLDEKSNKFSCRKQMPAEK